MRINWSLQDNGVEFAHLIVQHFVPFFRNPNIKGKKYKHKLEQRNILRLYSDYNTSHREFSSINLLVHVYSLSSQSPHFPRKVTYMCWHIAKCTQTICLIICFVCPEKSEEHHKIYYGYKLHKSSEQDVVSLSNTKKNWMFVKACFLFIIEADKMHKLCIIFGSLQLSWGKRRSFLKFKKLVNWIVLEHILNIIKYHDWLIKTMFVLAKCQFCDKKNAVFSILTICWHMD